MLEQPDPPTAIYAYNDETAARVLDVLIEQNVDVPGRMALLGTDDSVLASTLRPRLSSVVPWPHSEVVAADAIAALVRGERVPRLLTPEPLRVARRDTT